MVVLRDVNVCSTYIVPVLISSGLLSYEYNRTEMKDELSLVRLPEDVIMQEGQDVNVSFSSNYQR